MRYARVKPDQVDTFMHVYNRTVGTTADRPFGAVEKEELLRRLRRQTELYVIEVIAVQCLSNHFHAILHIPADPPSPEEAAERYERYYKGKRSMDPGSPECAKLARKLRDVSEFMKDWQQPFTRWFNRTRPIRRRGHLWADRFKNTVLENGLALWDCWLYIEMNPVRAGMVASPADYRFCTFGQWTATGRHPYAASVEKHAMPGLGGLLHVDSLAELHQQMREDFACITATEARQRPEQIDAAVAVAAEKEPFSTRLDRRVRYWVDGLVIGSELFVKTTMAQTRGWEKVQKRRLTRARDRGGSNAPLYSFKQLRVLLQ